MANFRIDANNLIKSMTKAEAKSKIAIKMFATEGAKKFETYAKLHRPWTDRTGNARKRLVGWVETLTNKIRIYIGHGVSYGIYLEKRWDGRYAILQKTVNANAEEVLEGYKELIKYFRK